MPSRGWRHRDHQHHSRHEGKLSGKHVQWPACKSVYVSCKLYTRTATTRRKILAKVGKAGALLATGPPKSRLPFPPFTKISLEAGYCRLLRELSRQGLHRQPKVYRVHSRANRPPWVRDGNCLVTWALKNVFSSIEKVALVLCNNHFSRRLSILKLNPERLRKVKWSWFAECEGRQDVNTEFTDWNIQGLWI